MKHLLSMFIIALALTSCVWGQTQSTGSIAGIVLDPKGNSAAGVTVTARAMVRSASELRPAVKTDTNGRFLINNCPFGYYLILALNPRPTIAAVNASFVGTSVVTTVAVVPRAPVARIMLKFGRNTGILTGKITDAATGQPVTAALEVKPTAGANDWIAAALPPHYRVIVPTGTDLAVTVSAPGYQTWYYPGTPGATAPSPLNLQQGAKTRVNVSLQPAN